MQGASGARRQKCCLGALLTNITEQPVCILIHSNLEENTCAPRKLANKKIYLQTNLGKVPGYLANKQTVWFALAYDPFMNVLDVESIILIGV